jgi:hypothetical protein
MKPIRFAIVLLLTMSTRVVAAPAPAPVPPAAPAGQATPPADASLPSVDQLKQQLAEGKHQDVLKQVAKLLLLKGEAAKAYDRYELFSLRGEAALRAKQPTVAADAFAQAAKATDDPVNQATARGTELLIRRSKPLGYVPRTAPAGADAKAKPATPAQPIPFIEPDGRKAALTALLADERAVVEPKVRAATKAEGLAPVIDAIKGAADLRAIEVAASGSSEQTKSLVGDLGEHAHRLISAALGKMKVRTEDCWAQGSRHREYVLSNGFRQREYGMVGLTSTEQNDLKSIITTCQQVEPVAGELATVTGRAELIADMKDATQLLARATEVLKYDYPNAGRYNQPTNVPGATR